MTSSDATMDIGGWLRGLGLGQYEAAFRENEIDTDVSWDLTETDLEKLGLPLGHRKRLLKAIANLNARARNCRAHRALRPHLRPHKLRSSLR